MVHLYLGGDIRSLHMKKVQPVKAGVTKLENLRPEGYGSQLPGNVLDHGQELWSFF